MGALRRLANRCRPTSWPVVKPLAPVTKTRPSRFIFPSARNLRRSLMALQRHHNLQAALYRSLNGFASVAVRLAVGRPAFGYCARRC